MRIGSDAHKELFCRTFLEAHLKFEPEDLPWPDMEGEQLERLRGIPFWTEAITTEKHAGVMVQQCAEAADDPLVREAIALQAYEEARHGRILQHMIDRYELAVEDREIPKIGPDPERAFVDFGYGECLDSFGAFGIYALAREVEYLPPPILSIFENVVQEEANHIVFFINWVAWRQVRRGRPARLQEAKAIWHYGKALARHVAMGIRDNRASNRSFTATGGSAFVANLTPTIFLETCLRENEYRLARFHPDLLRPTLMPNLAKAGLAALRLLPPYGRRDDDA